MIHRETHCGAKDWKRKNLRSEENILKKKPGGEYPEGRKNLDWETMDEKKPG